MSGTHPAKKRRTETWSPDRSARGLPPPSNRDFSNQRDQRSYNRNGRQSYRPSTSNSDRTSAPKSKPYSRSYQPHGQNNAHTTRSRKSNPSTRIRSLRKQLAHASAATLPANILMEKERELQYLIDTQAQAKSSGRAGRPAGTGVNGAKVAKRGTKEKKMLGKYHMVRFFERKKAERELKKARKAVAALEAEAEGGLGEMDDKEASASDKKHRSMKELADEVRARETDLLYCIYAPLGEKYISLFAGTAGAPSRENNPTEAPTSDKKRKADMLEARVQNPEVVRLNTRSNASESDDFRPPHWHAVRAILDTSTADPSAGTKKEPDEQDVGVMQVPADNDAWTSVAVTEAQLQKLDALRERQNAAGDDAAHADLAVRARISEARPTWQQETDAPIDPADADAASDDDDHGGMALDAGEASESDGDGGFFER
ncbi:uncharacterized protein HMPREF1541_00165 [Cyphellophora europaea CBS 101466]|uniref:rRNA-processing protein EFG1 n=1 Tax=Cyphellophora europaea (strain CBS 101466) TaxID=1220924 RepID=W2SD84_CYPE1|nr:uncharacterized protein HMPREF1541_00165 [Cyphellophora europaea CBS 101466]ETN45983.1 hypothetical protein HMPREF1541_00165 [Cyphellophora europaea CBS 101466]